MIFGRILIAFMLLAMYDDYRRERIMKGISEGLEFVIIVYSFSAVEPLNPSGIPFCLNRWGYLQTCALIVPRIIQRRLRSPPPIILFICVEEYAERSKNKTKARVLRMEHTLVGNFLLSQSHNQSKQHKVFE